MGQVQGSWGSHAAHRRISSLVRSISSLLAALVVLLATAAPGYAQSGVATMEVVNHISGLPVAGINVIAKKRVGDTFTWVAQKPTDAAGRASFQLAGLGTTATYVFFCNPYGNGSAQSRDVTKPGTYRFPVGTLAVRVVAGGTLAPMPNVQVTIKERLADSSLRWVGQPLTDANGRLKLDPAGLGSGRTYVLEAASPWDGTIKRSNDIRDRGELTFVVGNAPLKVTLVNAITLQPIPQIAIAAREKLADGTFKWVAERVSDANGRVVFDLPGLGSGRTYVLAATVYHGLRVTSSELTAAGEFVFKVGTLEVKVQSASGNVLPGLTVQTYELLADGSRKGVNTVTTDAAGILRLDLAGLGKGRLYVFRAISPLDGTAKWSNAVTSPGRVTFVVGNAPLRVKLMNGITSDLLPGKTVSARERLSDGSSRWVIDRTTDAKGIAIFDLEGLGSGRTYFLTAKPYNGGTATSADLRAAGDYSFKVGMLEVAAVNPGSGAPLVNVQVDAREKLADGSYKWITGGLTDAQGVIRFDLPGLGSGRTYVLEAKSPVDATTKRSDALTATGRYTFRVGNAPLTVVLTNALSGDMLPNVKINVSERLADGKLTWVAARTTDDTGRAVFDLAGLGNGRTYVLSAAPYNGGTVYSDDLREAGRYDFRVGSVEVTVVKAVDGSLLPEYKVNAYEKGADGKLTWVASGYTDAQGIIRFDFLGLKSGKTYVLDAKSPLDGTTKRSQDITAIGKIVFRVGNAPVVLTLLDALSGNPLPNVSVTVKERTASKPRWIRDVRTDANGQALIDLDGLANGRVYFFSTDPFGTGSIDSANVTRSGPFEFAVGNLEVLVLSGIDGQPLANTDISVYEVLPLDPNDDKKDKNWQWRRWGTTDANGYIRFDLAGLGAGRTYVLQADSPVDGSAKYSEPLSTTGHYTFVVGNEPLRVTVVNGITGLPLVDSEVTVYEVLPGDEKWQWTTWSATDENGVAVFDLDGLGDGRVYVLDMNPYESGGVQSGPITEPGDLVFRVGTVPVTLIDGDNNVPLVGAHIDVYEIHETPPGDDDKDKKDDKKRVQLQWVKHADTDDNGVIQFDLEGVSRTTPDAPIDGRRYVFVAWKPFGVEKDYFSGIITHEGPVLFRITREGSYPLDATSPSLSVSSPVDGANVDVSGFSLSGFAADNATISGVTVTVTDPVAGISSGQATYNAQTQLWSYTVTPNMITLGRTVAVAVRATDQANNETVVSLSVRVIVDTAAPVVAITSHANGDEVEKTGFLLAGTALDDIAVTSLAASVDDPVLGRTVDHLAVDVTPGSGQWTFTVLNGQMTQGQTVTVRSTRRTPRVIAARRW